MLAFDPTGSLAIFVYVIGALVLVGTFIEQQFRAFGWLRERLIRGGDEEEMPPILLLPSAASIRRSERVADVRILEFTPTGGGSASITFRVEVANYGTQRCRAQVAADVVGRALDCRPTSVDLLPDGPVEQVWVDVPRPELGDLVPALNNEPTLYNEALRLEVSCNGVRVSKEWREKVYDAETEYARYEAQQRAWRIGRGTETPGDRRAQHFDEREEHQ